MNQGWNNTYHSNIIEVPERNSEIMGEFANPNDIEEDKSVETLEAKKDNVLQNFCNLVSENCEYKSLKVLKNVIHLLHNEYFDLDLFRSKIKTLK